MQSCYHLICCATGAYDAQQYRGDESLYMVPYLPYLWALVFIDICSVVRADVDQGFSLDCHSDGAVWASFTSDSLSVSLPARSTPGWWPGPLQQMCHHCRWLCKLLHKS